MSFITDQNLQAAVLTMYRQGVARKAIARQLHLDVKTVRAIVRADCVREPAGRSNRISVDGTLLERLYRDCSGYVERMHEILTEEHGVDIGYSTLTRLVRAHGLGAAPKKRACHVPDVPGEEMQHDTSVHMVRIGGVKQKLISSGIYLRYSKMRYVRFYRRFNRFVMKCFLDEALRHWGYCARTCIIDNTNLAVLIGSGQRASMNPEMVAFAANYGFTWKAHEIGHANRKAGTERNFYTVETNFLPGRTFGSLEDLNAQAIEWATVRFAQRPQAKTKLIPVELFETEKSALLKLSDYIDAPYLPFPRRVDEYGYCSFDGNFYWVPESVSSKNVTMLQYSHHLRIMDGTFEAARYEIAADGVKNQMIVPPGHEAAPRGVPKNRKLGCDQEEKRLREQGDTVGIYLDMAKAPENGVKQCPAFIRGLYALSRQLGPSLFHMAVQRALDYRVFDRAALERIAYQIIKTDVDAAFPINDTPQEYRSRSAYLEGQFSRENDIDYSQLAEGTV
jgi:transposase